jgi:hypothetical protein
MSFQRIVLAGLLFSAAPFLGACKTSSPTPAQPPEHALSGLAAQHVVLLPTYVVRVAPGLGWTVPRLTEVARTQDADIAEAFRDRGIKTWILPSGLDSAFRRNPTYATDPHTLAEEPLRSPSLSGDQRLPEPIASQLRTIVALHDDTRLVLAPVELRIEAATGGAGAGAGAGAGRGVLRLVLVDARMSSVRWIGDVVSDPAPAFGPSITASIASKLSAVIAP